MRIIIPIIFFLTFLQGVQAQEMQAKFTIITSKVSNQATKKIFQTLQSALTNFINNRKWTKDVFQPQERINCNFLLTIDEDMGNNEFKGTLAIQAARPIYNTTYQSPIINFQDPDFQFKYVEFQPIEFNENRIQGSDPMSANITAMVA